MEEVNFVEEFEKTKDKFDKYLKKNYDFRTTKIKHKYNHTFRVVELAERIARDLDLNEEDVYIAKLGALLHDIGRFEQIKSSKDYEKQKKLDHGKLAVDILFKDGLLREFLDETVYDNIIRETVFNHNKYEIETKRLSEHELLHVKILRDADKTDALFNRANDEVDKTIKYSLKEVEESEITEEVYEEFMDEKTVLKDIVKTPADKWMVVLAYIFGYYFTSGLKVVLEEGYIDKIKDKIEFKNEETISKAKNMYRLAENHIIYRISNDINF